MRCNVDTPCVLHPLCFAHPVCTGHTSGSVHIPRDVSRPRQHPPCTREFLIDNLLVRIHSIILMIRWTGLAPWRFEFPFPGSLTSTFLNRKRRTDEGEEVSAEGLVTCCRWARILLSPPDPKPSAQMPTGSEGRTRGRRCHPRPDALS